jgi:hypothetical protein
MLRDMRSLRPSLLVLAIVLPACMRGCNPGCSYNSAAQRCSEQSDCPARTTCHAGYCIDEGYARIDDRCKASAGCADRGECEAITRRSFLGLDPSLECAATTDADCRQSKLCRTRGQCARGVGDVGCAATDAAVCRASERCTTHEECELEGGQCVRHWTGCPALVRPGQPAWDTEVRLVWDYESLRAPWHPGDVRAATIACEATSEHGGVAIELRVAGHCAVGPHLDHTGTAVMLRADVPLHVGDAIAYAVVRPASGTSFVQLRYDGSSPMLGGSGAETLECVVVPHAVAFERSRRELAAVDHSTAAAAHQEPDLASSSDLGQAIEDARVHAERASMWLGWDDPELATRVARLDAAADAWHVRLDAAIRKAATTDGPIRGGHMAVSRTARVCGDALRARLGTAAATRTIDATTCAIELAIDNTGKDPLPIMPDRDDFGDVDSLAWLRPAHDGQPPAVMQASVIAVQVGAASSTIGALDLPPGQRGTVLVDGDEPGSLLRGRLDLRSTFVMRP